ncbi:MAG TPA: class I SAM-dependent methyltransferase [Anaerolineales bacterium]|nr:class I SAM-dependent methyltransferase [Anaerolineales bacterium]
MPELEILVSPDWEDYELVDSGENLKLERYGPYQFVRPEPQAVWKHGLDHEHWQAAHARFQPSREESGGSWLFHKPVSESWEMGYKSLRFQAQTTAGRHLGVFPEQAAHWDWIIERIQSTRRKVKVLNLFGYTGLASLAAAQAGAQVTHVDASKKATTWARRNQALSNLENRPIRWIVDDALKFVQREGRRQSCYDGLILDPPKFGRGPKGEVWEYFKFFSGLMQACRQILTPKPLFIVVTAYAVRASALSLYYGLQENTAELGGKLEAGELALLEHSRGRLISTAIFARWQCD